MDIEEEPLLGYGDTRKASQESFQEMPINGKPKWISILSKDNLNYVFSLNSVAVMNAIAILASIYCYYATWRKVL
jgi:hypothetical protein